MPQYTLILTHQKAKWTPTGIMRGLRLTIKDHKVGIGPVSGTPHPFPQILGIILQLMSLWNYPAHKKWPCHISGSLAFWDGPITVCGACFSLNKSISYLSLCLSLNSFCSETQRTWSSVSPDTRWVILMKRPCIQVPIKGAPFQCQVMKGLTFHTITLWNGPV